MERFISFINSYSVYFCISLSVILHFLILNRKKKDLKINSLCIFIISILCNAICILASKLLYYLEFAISNNGILPKIIFDAGFSFFGTVYFAPIFYTVTALILKLNVKKVLDIATPAVLISSFCCRLNCMFAGCCTGIEILNTGIKVPTREIELACYLSIFILLIYKDHKNILKLGTAYPIYLIIYGIVRMIEEPFRLAFKNSNIHFALIHSTASIAVGGLMYWIFTRKSNIYKETSKNKP